MFVIVELVNYTELMSNRVWWGEGEGGSGGRWGGC